VRLRKFYCPSHGLLGTFSSNATVICGERVRVKPGVTRRCNRTAQIGAPKGSPSRAGAAAS